jgi:hypothetical protein
VARVSASRVGVSLGPKRAKSDEPEPERAA